MQQATDKDNQLTIEGLIQILRSRIWIVVGATVVGTLAAIAIALLLTPIYRAEVLLAPVAEGGAESNLQGIAGQLGGLASLAGVALGNTGGSHAEAVATLKSRVLTTALINDLNLLPHLYPDRWDAEQHSWKANEEVPTPWEGERLFAKVVRKVVDDKKTGLVTLAIEWKDPKLAAAWAAELVARTNQTLRTRTIERSQANVAFLQEQLETSSIIELRQAISQLLEGEIKKIMMAQGSEEYAFKVIDPAVVPQKKDKPNRTLIVIAGFVGSLFLSSFFCLLLPPIHNASTEAR